MWSNIIFNLADNTNNADIELKKAAIQTLGAICEALVNFDLLKKDVARQNNNIISADLCNSILSGILLGMNAQDNTPDVLLIAIKSFRDSLSFLKEYFGNENILKFSIDLLIKLSGKDDEEIAINALMSLNDFVQIQYQKIGGFINVIYQALVKHLMSNNPEIAMQAVDIWATIATEEVSRKNQQVK